MALKGTLSDFGVADILQLISQQSKTGILILSNDIDVVRVYFDTGAVVRAHDAVRTPEMYIGSLMVRAGLMTRQQFDEVLAEQQRSLRRLGELLIERGYASSADVREFAQLQLTETLYPLFRWNDGTYQFDAQNVEGVQDGISPIKAEAIVMSGVRMMDEWGAIRERIPSYGWMAEAVRSLPRAVIKEVSDSFDFSALGDELGTSGAGGSSIGDYERKVFKLIEGGCTVQSLIDRSRLGEFETLSGLSTLMTEGYVRVIKPPEVRTADVGSVLTPRQRLVRLATIIGRAGLSAGMVIIAISLLGRATAGGSSDAKLEDSAWQKSQATAQQRVLLRSAEVYRLRTGSFAPDLGTLVEAGLLTQEDLHHPFENPYQYLVEGDQVRIYPPVR